MENRSQRALFRSDHFSSDRSCISSSAIVCNILGLFSPCFALRRMLSAMCCTRVELTGCGSVATAPASASSIAAIRSGENEAFEKSFIRCVQFVVVRERVSRQPAGRPHVPHLRRSEEQIMLGDHYTASLGDAPDAPRQPPAHPQQDRSG